ncbi:glycosyltransferase family 2 protein [Flavobacterium jejuense]|uniref:Glycosyltransferase family 2 protein n=1 Tax=Flavobacterium jejuense TaxID=1544455 RepID=A0ABX0IYC8_9FLAO|nr:glycosyltransferase family 2 protein [Flavobacterium jejuense]NHN27568.1 glycosyltransferase family 2 protein [Flavobacterium jejuense]
MPLFSVIIPVYNKVNYIEETLKSVLEQRFTDYEIIIIDDGSTDSSLEIINQFLDNRICIYKQENKGVAAARNFGIEKSKGKLIAFLDADDYWFPNHLEEIVKLYHDFPNCGMYCNLYRIKTAKKYFQKISFRGIEKDFRGIVINYFYSNKPFRISWTSATAVPKYVLEFYNGFNSSVTIGEDIELWTKIGIKYPVALSNKITAIYNFIVPQSLSKQNINTMSLMNFEQFKEEEIKNKYLKEFLDIYKFFYAIQFKSIGKTKRAKKLFNSINKKNIGIQNQILFSLPSFFLKLLYSFKRKLKTIGIEFSTYN